MIKNNNKTLEDTLIQDAYLKMRTRQEQQQEISEVTYPGNIGVMEVSQFYQKAKKANNNNIIDKVNDLIRNKNTSKAWQIIQEYLGVKLHGKPQT